jgi:glycerol-3-phosphate O-acyltransferase
LMVRIRAAVPVLPVPLSAAVVARAGGTVSRAAFLESGAAMVEQLRLKGALQHLPGGDAIAALNEGRESLMLRGILEETGGQLRIVAGQEGALSFYAASVLQRLGEADAPLREADEALQLPEAGET